MKTKDIKNLHTKDKIELKQMAQDLKKEIFSLNLDKVQNKLKNQRSIFEKRKDLARVLTILRGKAE